MLGCLLATTLRAAPATTGRAAPVVQTAPVVQYVIVADSSAMVMQTYSGGLLGSLAQDYTIAFRRFSGAIAFAPNAADSASFSLVMSTDSLVVLNRDLSGFERREVLRKTKEDALETSRYPEIAFRSTRVAATSSGPGRYDVAVSGMLTLHGVTRPTAFRAQITLAGPTLRARGEFRLKQSDYGIRRVMALGNLVRVKDEVRFAFDAFARARPR